MAKSRSNRTGSVERASDYKQPPMALMRALQASPVNEEDEEDSSIMRKRAKTDTIENSDTKTNERSLDESQDL